MEIETRTYFVDENQHLKIFGFQRTKTTVIQ